MGEGVEMYISEIIEIENYRNLSGRTIKFDKTINFLIGENNIGKTNILELIHIFCVQESLQSQISRIFCSLYL